ncbi:hypothetical protein KR222_005844, partial [Zaprionus bogoriensis]
VGFIFIFNLIVGTGALTLPGAFARAGWCLSFMVLLLLAIISFITVTFVIESMACANAIKIWQNQQYASHRIANEDGGEEDDRPADRLITSRDVESIPLIPRNEFHSYYQLTHKFELGEMATLFFNSPGRILFYLCLIVYLYGDLCIYSAAVATSLRDVVCDRENSSINSNISMFGSKAFYYVPEDLTCNERCDCWSGYTISRLAMYRIILLAFALIFGPLVFCQIQKTKYLQILTAVLRWMAFAFMIGIAFKMIIMNGVKGYPVVVNFYGVPSLFGACVYSFMCHHSLPSLLEPLRNKLMVSRILAFDFILICMFYIVLAMSAIFAFRHVQDLYTLNFLPFQVGDKSYLSTTLIIVVDYFLSLFPVFTLSTSFPIIAVTLKFNLQTIFLDMSQYDTYNVFIRLLFPILTIFPPFCVTYFTDSLSTLVAFTGSYAGVGIQYVIPISMVYFARRTCTELLGSGISNPFHSPFKSNSWLVFILFWSISCVLLVTINIVH